jgi:hypothetical protein
MNGSFLKGAAYRHSDIVQREQTGSSGDSETSASYSDIHCLASDIERLLMVTEALWGILKERHGYTDEDLAERIQEIDLRDGQLDGRVAKGEPKKCPNCERVLIGERPVCLYCGHCVRPDWVFDR